MIVVMSMDWIEEQKQNPSNVRELLPFQISIFINNYMDFLGLKITWRLLLKWGNNTNKNKVKTLRFSPFLHLFTQSDDWRMETEIKLRICSSNLERTDKAPFKSALFTCKGWRDALVAVTVLIGFLFTLLIHAFFIQLQMDRWSQ